MTSRYNLYPRMALNSLSNSSAGLFLCRNFIATHLPRLSFTNPTLPINLKITPSPRIGKCKNPDIIKEKEELRERIAGGGEEFKARVVVELGGFTDSIVDQGDKVGA